MGPIMVLLNQVFPCFHCLSKPLLHTFITYFIFFFSVEGANEMLLNCHMCHFSIFGIVIYFDIKIDLLKNKG